VTILDLQIDFPIFNSSKYWQTL